MQDRSHRPNTLSTTLTPAQEALVVEMRRTLLLPLHDLLALTHEFINRAASRSGLDRCLRRDGVNNLQDLIPVAEGRGRPDKDVQGLRARLPARRHQIPPADARRDAQALPLRHHRPSHRALGIEHRLAPPRHPQTNGMVERFNGRISELSHRPDSPRPPSSTPRSSSISRHITTGSLSAL